MKRLSLLMLLLASMGYSQQTYIYCGKLIDTRNGKLQTEKTVVVSGNRIVDVLNGYVSPTSSADKVVDLKDKTVLPGLVDMHVHIESETNSGSYVAKFTENEADIAFQSTVYAKRTLMAGFTTVRDLGGTGVNIALRKAIDKGTVPGPRIFTAGKSIATTGGHADPTNGYKNSLMGDPGAKEGVVNSPEEARKAVRQRYKDGADVIKITATGGVLSVAKSGRNPQFFVDEIEAITETARDYGMLVAAHAHGDEGIKRAVIGGVKTIEHGTFMSDESMELMKKYQAYLVPTITAGKEVAEKAEIAGYYPDIVTPKAKEVGPQIQGTFSRAYKKGVPIVFGTDAGVFPHGQNAREFGYMVEAGMKPIESIQAATVTAAMLLDEAKNIGQIDKGFYADIIATDENPLDNIHTLENVTFVMKNGEVYKG